VPLPQNETATELPAEARRAIDQALAEPPLRIRGVRTSQGAYWLKRAEALSFYWRLRKGNGQAAFARDLRAMHLLGRAGLPVPKVLAEGVDYFVTPDCGQSLAYLLRDSIFPEPDRSTTLGRAGQALAGLHLAGYCHGRPSVRDLLWDGAKITLIDFERFRRNRNRPVHMAMDLLIATQSVFACSKTAGPEARALVEAYAFAAPKLMARMRARLALIRWPVRLAAALPFRRGLGKDLQATKAALDLLAQV
jgi:tRNA A-37 threonylcarbamoyl transferase component Bud32